ncbi:MAG: hypothetical protein FWE62_05820, partial [Firmicutes bacterium]|nr:hypothetical protein [Bacillota bacterium]
TNANGSKTRISPTGASGSDSSLDKNGKYKLTVTVEADEIWICVHSREVEVISQTALQARIVKNRKLRMDKAKELYNANKAAANAADLELEYERAAASYKVAKNNLSVMKNNAFIAGSTSFFGVYAPILILLGIAFAVNKKIGCAKTEEIKEANN